ncbi:hypothetical protein LEL_00902 [Akanthomyces lecanii RCEF 1005]|uniref:Uncharacterized protein n=1 Tax=Akanthomyces lecanii RCEF 1005 TaxID=1081108 RepID=A0A168K8H2_CORDF|nr:hypothetical protein LEL_00902 [Akanthomyces lecanii RCEF 1005]
MFHPYTQDCFRDAVTFDKWALLAALYFRPWPSTPTGLPKVAKAVSLLGLRREPRFEQYQSYHKTSLESLPLPSPDSLASRSNFKLIFLTSPASASIFDDTGPLPSSRSGVVASPLRPADSAEQLEDFNTEQLCDFLKNLDATNMKKDHDGDGDGYEPPSAVTSREASVIVVDVDGLTLTERPTTTVARLTGETDSKTSKHRLSSSPDGLLRSPTKNQDRGSISINTPAAGRQRSMEQAPTGKAFFGQLDSFMATVPERIGQLQAPLDCHTCRIAPNDSQAAAADRQADRDALQETSRQLEMLKAQFEQFRAAQEEKTTQQTARAREASATAAEEQATAIRREVEAQVALVRADLAAESEERKQDAKTAKQGQDRLDTTIKKLEGSVSGSARAAKQEKAARERYRAEVDAAIREIKERSSSKKSTAPPAASAALAEDVCRIVDEHLPRALRQVLQRHARAKEEAGLKHRD